MSDILNSGPISAGVTLPVFEAVQHQANIPQYYITNTITASPNCISTTFDMDAWNKLIQQYKHIFPQPTVPAEAPSKPPVVAVSVVADSGKKPIPLRALKNRKQPVGFFMFNFES